MRFCQTSSKRLGYPSIKRLSHRQVGDSFLYFQLPDPTLYGFEPLRFPNKQTVLDVCLMLGSASGTELCLFTSSQGRQRFTETCMIVMEIYVSYIFDFELIKWPEIPIR